MTSLEWYTLEMDWQRFIGAAQKAGVPMDLINAKGFEAWLYSQAPHGAKEEKTE